MRVIPCSIISAESSGGVFSRVDVALKARGCGHIDFILGGPPCQAYSTVGRSRKNMDGDPRNTLYKLYFQALERYQPTMFVFENVPGLLTAGGGSYLTEIVSGFKERGYELEKHILNAADYGVLQNRKRIILIGWKKGSGHYYPKLNKSVKKYRVNDLFEDLPTLMPGEEKDYYCKDVINEYGLQLNAYALSEDFSSLDIFVSVLSENNSPKSISQTDIDAAIKRGVQLYQKAINDLYTSFERDKEV